MRITPQQRKGLLDLLTWAKDDGIEQANLLGPEWKMFDRLVGKGLAEKRFVTMTGPVYHINNAGRAVLGLGQER